MKRKKNTFWATVANLILRNRFLIIGGIILLTVFFGTQWKYMRFTFTEANLLPADHPENIKYSSFKNYFGEEGNIISIGINDSIFLNNENTSDKIFYTTGRLTSEMVIKTVQMGIPILISRSGFTESGVTLAKQAGLTLIGRAKGKRMIIANGIERIVFDSDVKSVKNEDVVSAQRSIIS